MAASRTVFLRGHAYGLCEECAYKLEPQRTDYIEKPRPCSSRWTLLALALFVAVVGLLIGWALGEALRAH